MKYWKNITIELPKIDLEEVSDKLIELDIIAVVIKDNYPVTKHHCLIIPKRHCVDYFNLYQPEIIDVLNG